MSEKYIVDHKLLKTLAAAAAVKIQADDFNTGAHLKVFAVPRGGVPAALAIGNELNRKIRLVDDVAHADIIIDDLVDSGATMARYDKPFYVLVDKREPEWAGKWIVWPWEAGSDGDVEDNVRRLLQFVGEDPNRGGLLETPARVAKAWLEWCAGYAQDPADILKVFEDGADGYDEMIVVRDIPFYSKCEHHMADIFGTATIAYIPNPDAPRIVGLSKLSRLLDVYARRLQVQERLTAQVADSLMEHLKPKGAGVVIKARHMCMESRGINKQGSSTVTSALRGVFKTEPDTRAEFMSLTRD